MPKLGAAAFLGEGDLNHVFRFPGTGVSSKCLCLHTGRRDAKGGGGSVQKNQGGCVLFFFFSKGFVINRKGCEAEIAESIPL